MEVLGSEDYFMACAVLTSQRSSDPKTKVGACIVKDGKKVVALGYNCMPQNNDDGKIFTWRRRSEAAALDKTWDHKHSYVCHSELNAVVNSNSADISGCHIYVTLFPCNQCSKLLIQSGIRKVIYLSDKYHNMDDFKASRYMLENTNVEVQRFVPEKPEIIISLQEPEKKNKKIKL